MVKHVSHRRVSFFSYTDVVCIFWIARWNMTEEYRIFLAHQTIIGVIIPIVVATNGRCFWASNSGRY